MTAQQESAKATDEHLATKSQLESTLAELSKQKEELSKASETAQADYKDLNDSMTQLVEEANRKAADAEARLSEVNAQLKVKDAELAEAKLAKPTPVPKGLRASKFAEDLDSGEDSSSVALASVRTPIPYC